MGDQLGRRFTGKKMTDVKNEHLGICLYKTAMKDSSQNVLFKDRAQSKDAKQDPCSPDITAYDLRPYAICPIVGDIVGS